jgi:pentapeptide MXKDX repeat protein
MRPVTNPAAASSLEEAADVASRNQLEPKGRPHMTTTTRIGLSLSAALVSLGLAFAPAVFAQDKMGKDDGMKKESMSKDAMKKDDGMMKKDGMKKDGMSHDGMMKDGSKDSMKKN